MGGWLQRPLGRIIAAGGLLAIIALAAVAFYIYGPSTAGSGATSGANSGGGATSAAATLAPTATGKVFTLDASASQASFTTHEVLLGQPRSVVGTTNGVSGQILVDQSAPSQSKVGQIRVDLTGLTTDSDMRNQTIQNRILETGDPANQYATFVTKSITGLPSSIAIGQKVTFTLTGDLTIHQVTRTATFTASATLTSATQLTGQAQTTVRYSDYTIAIPNVPNVSDVSDTVTLALTFTANAG
ncbi:MAG TPA: YceI family protein [Ktedonobacterales bacterium]